MVYRKLQEQSVEFGSLPDLPCCWHSDSLAMPAEPQVGCLGRQTGRQTVMALVCEVVSNVEKLLALVGGNCP